MVPEAHPNSDPFIPSYFQYTLEAPVDLNGGCPRPYVFGASSVVVRAHMISGVWRKQFLLSEKIQAHKNERMCILEAGQFIIDKIYNK